MVKSARKLIGATNPLEAEPGTIRGDLAVQTGRNVVHGSDSPENGERETGACTVPPPHVPARLPSPGLSSMHVDVFSPRKGKYVLCRSMPNPAEMPGV